MVLEVGSEMKYIKHYERMRKNPNISLTYIGKGNYNVFRETDGMDLGNYHWSNIVKTMGFSKKQLDDVKKEGTTNFVRIKSDKVIINEIKDLRKIVDEVTTSDLQGIVMALSSKILGISLRTAFDNYKLRDIFRDMDEALLNYAYGDDEIEDVLVEIEKLRGKIKDV